MSDFVLAARRRCPPLLLMLLFGSLPAARGASAFDFDVWMRDMDKRSVSVQRHLRLREGEPARADAAVIEDLYDRMATWFERAGQSADAVQISRDGQAQAAGIREAIERQDFDAAHGAALRIARACNDCHDNYKPFP